MKINVKRLALFWCFALTLSFGIFLGRMMAPQTDRQQDDDESQDLLVNLTYQMVQSWCEGRGALLQTIEVKRDGSYFGEPVYLATGKVTGEDQFYLRFRAKSHSPIELRIGDSTIFYDR